MLRVILSISVIVFCSYILIAQQLNLLPYALLLTGILTLVTGLIVIRENRKSFWGYVNIVAAVFVFFIVIYTSQLL
ncbi:DUF3953 domain-containing protein [Sediminibacillus massiliensis]|uniref:DUF3953 domain-containing protein n=1 Tax=Sediminibacillus massiliensis TaxID=1926277 RepID=UPI003CCC467A